MLTSMMAASLFAASCAAPRTGTDALPDTTTMETDFGSAVGLGDPVVPWAGNPGYDVSRYDWGLRFDPTTGTLSGTDRITATALQDKGSVSLDYTGPAPLSIRLNGEDASFDYEPPKIQLETDLLAGDEFEVEIVLGGSPEQTESRTGWLEDGELVYTVAVVPGDTASWIPVNDTPRDPAVFTVRIEADGGLSGIVSGTPGDTDPIIWETPIPVSEVGLAIGVFENRRADGLTWPTLTISWPRDSIAPSEQATDDEIAAALPFLESFLGPFPFPTLGLTKIGALRGGNSTPGQIFLGVFDRLTVTHELAHQWIGGSVGSFDSSDSWWREGIPEYLALAWIATQDRGDDLTSTMREMYDQLGPTTRALRDVTERGDRGDRATYMRGALSIHAMHVAMGDDAFRKGLAGFAVGFRGRSASTEDLITAMQRHTDVALAALLPPWIDEEGLPPFPG
ncbi:MAG: M1 family aminopeptidase [Acidimicrobiia bacterium]